jgi:phosphatidylserine/phosphatidylglycerophosphate/cardiolipin synthase-like enzyme/uncharacterized membrane protein YdjX (TVP38/TMEM64 family)
MAHQLAWLSEKMKRPSRRAGFQRGTLIQNEDCWQVATTRRAAVLIDAATYFGALRESLLLARRRVFLVGWDVDSRMRLVGPSGKADDGYPEELGPFLVELVTRRPELRINIVLWDYSMLYALEREPLPMVNLNWMTPEQISICLDDQFPFASSHHQKIVVIDDAVAFSGGIDLTIRRWDTPSHDGADPRRRDPGGEIYPPFHDIQMVVDGDAASALAQLVRKRWRDSTSGTVPALFPTGDPWPGNTVPDFRDVPIAIARTCPAYRGRPEVREVESLYMSSIGAAADAIYIESQYLTANCIAHSLAERMIANPRLEVLIVGPNLAKGWLEDQSMGAGRHRFMRHLYDAGVGARVRLMYPCLPGEEANKGIFVHSKFMVVDDRFLRVGSANLNNRSMGTDSECDLVVKAKSMDHRISITKVRNRLIAEHLGVKIDDVEQALETHPTFLKAVDGLLGRPRTLRPVELGNASKEGAPSTIEQFADPERPILPPAVFGNLFGANTSSALPTRWGRFLAIAFVVLAFVALWRYTPLADLANPKELIGWLRGFGSDSFMPFVIILAYLIGGMIAFPVTVLIAVTGMMFEPLTAITLALGGSLLSAVATFQLGCLIGGRPLRGFLGPKVSRLNRILANRGILSVMAMRMLPVAPFTLVNFAAGAIRVRLADFLLGTVLGMFPGILILTLMGYQFVQSLTDPDPIHILFLGLGIAAMFSLGLAIQRFAEKRRAVPNE